MTTNDSIYQARRAPRREFLTVRGLRHGLHRWGPDDGEPWVLLHGFQDNGATFQFLVDELPDDWPCIAIDWRGFGASEWAPGGYWFPDYFADLEALLDRLVGDRPARLVGHSMGGNVATQYAGIRPQRVAALVSLEGFGLPRRRADDAPGQIARWLDQLGEPLVETSRHAGPREFGEWLSSRNPRLSRDRALFIAQHWLQRSEGGWRHAFDPRHRHVNPVLYRREEVEASWRRIQAPTLLLLGDSSEYRPRLGEDGTDDYFADKIADLRIVTLAQAGHMLHHEQPAECARHIMEFAARLP
ncbi:MAG: alpha/beta hydrolase [Steroidobacteraceae bacterium]